MRFLKEDSNKELYMYDGPVYNAVTMLAQDAKYYTYATSKLEARNNIINQIKKKMHQRYIDIESGFIYKIEKDAPVNPSFEQIKFDI